jgi:hypothetical protein
MAGETSLLPLSPSPIEERWRRGDAFSNASPFLLHAFRRRRGIGGGGWCFIAGGGIYSHPVQNMLTFTLFYLCVIIVSYNCIKIFHIVSASLLLTSMIYSYLSVKSAKNTETTVNFLQNSAFMIVLPLAVIQLFSGFIMLSLKQTELTQLWVKGSIVGFIIGITSWFGWCYFMQSNKYPKFTHTGLLITSILGLLTMLFFMTTRLATIYG